MLECFGKVNSSIFMMSDFVKQIICTQFFFCGMNILPRKLWGYYRRPLVNSQLFLRVIQNIKESRDSVNHIEDLVLENHRITIRQLADTVGISKGSLNMIPRDLRCLEPIAFQKCSTVGKNASCWHMCNNGFWIEDIIKRIITEADIWIYSYDSNAAEQLSEYRAKGVTRPKKRRQSHSKIKDMLTVFSDYRGVVHYEFLPTRINC